MVKLFVKNRVKASVAGSVLLVSNISMMSVDQMREAWRISPQYFLRITENLGSIENIIADPVQGF